MCLAGSTPARVISSLLPTGNQSEKKKRETLMGVCLKYL